MTSSDSDSTRARSVSRSGSGEWARRLRVGDRVSDYVLERELGEGGMGSVFVARHVTTGQEVALKVMLVDPDVNAGALERFRREGQAQAAGGKHPNVLQVHTAGEQAGCAFLVMELARGGDLKARLRQGPLEPRAAAALIAGLARGLAHVHAQGVLHRDLKPGNVVFDDGGAPKLMDFGLARLAGADKLTQTGTMLGTPAYMAPEQAGGEAVDERADVYGLAAVLYHCLTGRPPFAGDSTFVLVRKVLTEKPTRPREVNPAVPPALEQLVLRALSKPPEARFPTAKALADELDRFLAGELVAPRRGRGSVVALGAGACALVAAVAWWATRGPTLDEGGAVVPAPTTSAPAPPRKRGPAGPPSVTLREPAPGWHLVGHDVDSLELVGEATGAVVTVLVTHGRADPVPVAAALPARVALRPGWTKIVVRTSDEGGTRRADARLDVVRLRPELVATGTRTVRNERDGSELVLVPDGTVQMRWTLDEQGPLEPVVIERPFFMGVHEVTWAQFDAYAAATGATPPSRVVVDGDDAGVLVSDASSFVPGPRDPVYNLLLDEAHDYCRWAGLRVPTAAEWVHAATNGQGDTYPWGAGPAPGTPEWKANPRANLDRHDPYPYLAPVGSFPEGRSLLGLEDMIGNVWEWVVAPTTDDGVTLLYSFGGGWRVDPRPVSARLASGNTPGARRPNNGLRVVADVD
jgi:formylglycine-generating enzyme required for sulfatase activity